jgi:excisionase family DNA binding protein
MKTTGIKLSPERDAAAGLSAAKSCHPDVDRALMSPMSSAAPSASEASDDPARLPAVRLAFLSVKQFATVVGVSENTVLRRIQDNTMHAVRIGRLWRIPVSEVGRLLG